MPSAASSGKSLPGLLQPCLKIPSCFPFVCAWSNIARVRRLLCGWPSALRLEGHTEAITFVAFSPDGKALAYAVVENGVGNVWAQPLDGSKGQMLTNFTSDQIWTFQFSPDGKALAVVRTHVISDVDLLHEATTASR